MARIRQPPTFANMTGSQLISAMINCFFFGIAFLMTLQYFRRYSRKDPIYVRVMISMMITLATLQTIFVNHQSYRDTISRHDGVQDLRGVIEFTIPGKFICVYLTQFIAQMFFAARIWTLTKNVGRSARFAIIPLVALALLQLINGCILVHLEATSETFVDLGSHTPLLIRATAMQGTATAAADIVITVTLCYLYHVYGSVSSKVNDTVDRLIIYAINRAAATSICAMLSVFLYYFVSGTYYFIIPALMTSQLYIISVVSVLTSRESLRDDIEPETRKADSITKIESEKYSHSEKSV